MSLQVWEQLFNNEQLTDYSTSRYEEDRYTTQVIDISNEPNPQIQAKLVSASNFALPSEAYLEVEYKIVKASDDTAFDATDNIALINGWSLFDKVELNYNNINMETIDHPGTASQILGLLEDPEDYKSKGSLEYRFYDTNKQQTWVATDAGGLAANPSDAVIGVPMIPVANITAGADHTALATNTSAWLNTNLLPYLDSDQKANKGQEARLARCPPHQRNWIKLKLSDIFAVCKLNKPIRGMNMELRFTKQTIFTHCLLRGPKKVAPATGTPRALTDEGKVIIYKMNLVMPTLKPRDEIYLDVNSALNKGDKIPIDFQRIWCHMYPNAVGGVGTIPYSQRILSNTKRPRHMFVALRDSERRLQTGALQTMNPLRFDLPAAVKGYVNVGNVRHPNLDYDSSQDGFIRFYNAFLTASGKNADALASSVLDFNTWKTMYPILYFDLSHNDNQYELSMDSEIVLDLTLTDAPDKFDLIVIVISDEHKELIPNGLLFDVATVDKPGLRF